MRRITALFLLALLLLIPQRGLAQAEPELVDQGVAPVFGEHITFRVKVAPLKDVRSLMVFITPEGQPTVWQALDLSGANPEGELAQRVDVRQLTLAPFSSVDYHYEAVLLDGRKIQSPEKTFAYDDNRFSWQSLKTDTLEIYWYNSDSSLGTMIANIAGEGLRQASGILDAAPPAPLRIYAYDSSQDLQSALQMTNQPWVAGHATPELDMILISVLSGPERKLELERQVPHEIMHILQYQVMGPDFPRQPVWLVEGMASLVELTPNPEYRSVLETTAKSDSLLPMASLCSAFPRDAGGAFQAYAQSQSFVRFLYTRFGATGLRDLIDQYQNGLGCEEGFAAAFGAPLTQIENRWQQEELGVNIGGLVLSNLAPYLLIALLLIVPALLVLLPTGAGGSTTEKSV